MEELNLSQSQKQKKDDRNNSREPLIPKEMIAAIMPVILKAINEMYEEDNKGK